MTPTNGIRTMCGQGLPATLGLSACRCPTGGLIDLAGTATVRWRSRQSGFRVLRAVLELEGGLWL